MFSWLIDSRYNAAFSIYPPALLVSAHFNRISVLDHSFCMQNVETSWSSTTLTLLPTSMTYLFFTRLVSQHLETLRLVSTFASSLNSVKLYIDVVASLMMKRPLVNHAQSRRAAMA
jgi:hypothetical protein